MIGLGVLSIIPIMTMPHLAVALLLMICYSVIILTGVARNHFGGNKKAHTTTLLSFGGGGIALFVFFIFFIKGASYLQRITTFLTRGKIDPIGGGWQQIMADYWLSVSNWFGKTPATYEGYNIDMSLPSATTEEESGISHDNIAPLDLLYIITRRSNNEIRQNYIYFSETIVSDVIQTDEGVLFWIPQEKLLEREYTATYAAMLEHYTKREQNDNAVYVGVAENNNGKLKMNWSKCEDFERLK